MGKPEPQNELFEKFSHFNSLYFDNMLEGIEVKWSNRMTLSAGLCQFNYKEKFCSIRLSIKLLKFRPESDLNNTLLHEMIHAFLFLTSKIIDREGHGQEFQFHMNRINQISNHKITIYHSFKEEVSFYRQHIWKCNGKCQYISPFYGICKRSINRKPQPADWWFKQHQLDCGGEYIKISEPEPKKKQLDVIDLTEDIVDCPSCIKKIEQSKINQHLDQCLNLNQCLL